MFGFVSVPVDLGTSGAMWVVIFSPTVDGRSVLMDGWMDTDDWGQPVIVPPIGNRPWMR